MPEVALHHEGHPKYRRMVGFNWSVDAKLEAAIKPFTQHDHRAGLT
ncbi:MULTISPECIES: hypothetical protein [unclassified Mycobacterium]|nr:MULTISPECIES: hypothetical protein [unclassified Mycobacterium]MDP7704768.1 hypothetical protein [Mycobacterium sp. TY815]MDP7723185.1 hypothetical protein [Mycobacterium sp. TY814]